MQRSSVKTSPGLLELVWAELRLLKLYNIASSVALTEATGHF